MAIISSIIINKYLFRKVAKTIHESGYTRYIKQKWFWNTDTDGKIKLDDDIALFLVVNLSNLHKAAEEQLVRSERSLEHAYWRVFIR